MKFNTKLLISVIGMLTLCYQPPVIATGFCPEGSIEKASEETRTYLNNQYGFSFELPANYRASLNGSSISILDPVGYELNQCLIRRQEGTDNFYPEVTVSINPLKHSNLIDAIQQEAKTDVDFTKMHVIRTGQIAGQPAIVYSKETVTDKTVNVSFANPSGNYLITISAPIEHTEKAGEIVPTGIIHADVIKLVSSTFKFID